MKTDDYTNKREAYLYTTFTLQKDFGSILIMSQLVTSD